MKHKHNHRRDKSEMHNRHFMTKQSRRFMSQLLFYALSIIAGLIMIAVIWMYTVE